MKAKKKSARRPSRSPRVPRQSAIVAKVAIDFEMSGQRSHGEIVVGKPHVAIKGVEAKCSVLIRGLDENTFTLSGSDTLQALCLALQFAGRRLKEFIRKGGKIYFGGTDSEFPVDAYFALDRIGAKFTRVAEAHAKVLAVHGATFRKLAQ